MKIKTKSTVTIFYCSLEESYASRQSIKKPNGLNRGKGMCPVSTVTHGFSYNTCRARRDEWLSQALELLERDSGTMSPVCIGSTSGSQAESDGGWLYPVMELLGEHALPPSLGEAVQGWSVPIGGDSRSRQKSLAAESAYKQAVATARLTLAGHLSTGRWEEEWKVEEDAGAQSRMDYMFRGLTPLSGHMI